MYDYYPHSSDYSGLFPRRQGWCSAAESWGQGYSWPSLSPGYQELLWALTPKPLRGNLPFFLQLLKHLVVLKTFLRGHILRLHILDSRSEPCKIATQRVSPQLSGTVGPPPRTISSKACFVCLTWSRQTCLRAISPAAQWKTKGKKLQHRLYSDLCLLQGFYMSYFSLTAFPQSNPLSTLETVRHGSKTLKVTQRNRARSRAGTRTLLLPIWHSFHQTTLKSAGMKLEPSTPTFPI